LDIYATSIDYSPNIEQSIIFFKTVQNKMHWATHGQTAAEKIFYAVDSEKLHMGLYSFRDSEPHQDEVLIAKNYCNREEIVALNNLVSAYLEFAEMQARRKIPMYMNDWIEALDGFLKLSKYQILDNSGKISAQAAKKKAVEEYRKFKKIINENLSPVEKDYLEALEIVEQGLLKNNRER